MAGEIISQVTGPGIPLRSNDIDTDRIIPARFLKCVTFDGIGEHALPDDIKGLAAKDETHPLPTPVRQRRYRVGKTRLWLQSRTRATISQALGHPRHHQSYSEIFHGNCVSLAVPCFTAAHATCASCRTPSADPALNYPSTLPPLPSPPAAKPFRWKSARPRPIP